ncbi:hypothetical protein E4U21_002654 [Claviceps maximensis]|nr:hypothetical protein E4U21_002654 [Claviceps maximensis]
MTEQAFKKSSLNTVNRYRNRGIYDYKTVHGIIDKTPLLHISFSPSPSGIENDSDSESWYPVILPMLGCTGDFRNKDNDCAGEAPSKEPRDIYLHGYITSRLMRLASTHDKDVSNQGMPVCVAATLLDGVVLALTPNHHSCNYRSVVAYGRAHVVTDEAERKWAMELIMDNMVPGRWAATRYPNEAEQKRTGIIRVEIDSASAKVRAGTTGEDRADLKDEEMRRRVWAGVVPAHLVWGEPVAAPTNLMEPTPQYIEEWRRSETSEAREYAYAAAK